MIPDNDRIVFVHEDGTPTGETGPKLASHHGQTALHLAFSCYIFNSQGKLLVTKRAEVKKVWPGVWTNSVCGHPAPKETIEASIHRRARYELGMNISALQCVLPDYRYRTPPYHGIVEHEFCPVYVARSDDTPMPHPEEVADYRFIAWDELISALKADGADGTVWSYWCKQQVPLIGTPPPSYTSS